MRCMLQVFTEMADGGGCMVGRYKAAWKKVTLYLEKVALYLSLHGRMLPTDMALITDPQFKKHVQVLRPTFRWLICFQKLLESSRSVQRLLEALRSFEGLRPLAARGF